MNKVIIFFIAVFVFTGITSVARAEVASSTSSTISPVFLFTSTLRVGMSGTVEIVKLQEHLINNGYLQGYADGKFGRLTRAGVILFQNSHGLTPDGIVGMNTRAVLNSSITPIPNSPTVLSPNGGENWLSNSTQLIRWNVGGIYNTNSNVDIYLESRMYTNCGVVGPCPAMVIQPTSYVLDKNVSNSIPYNWIVGTDTNNQFIPAGSYVVKICIAGTNICDYSNGEFTISSGNAQPAVTVLSPNGGEYWGKNLTRTILWRVDNANINTRVDINLITPSGCLNNYSCTPYVGPTYILDRNIAHYSQYNWIVGTDTNNQSIPPGSYQMKVCIAGTNTCDFSDNLFTLAGLPI